MAKRDYYEVLGVSRTATQDELKAAFRGLARQYHPDVSKEADAEEKFKEINEAYAVLSEDDKRAAYDRYGHAGLNGAGGMPDFSTVDFSDIFEELFGFGGGMRSSSRRRNGPRAGADLRMSLKLDFEEAVFGVEKEIEFTRDETCSVCSGSGAKPGTSPESCQTCRGTGEVRQVRQTLLGSMVQVTTCPTCMGKGKMVKYPCEKCHGSGLERKMIQKKVTVPAGVDDGTRIRLAGEGEPGKNGGPRGNLYLDLRVKPHKFFRRSNDDILLDMNINVAQATLGAEIQIPTVDGEEALRIPAGTQPGKVFTLRGKGVPHLRSNGRGDQRVMINVQIPNHLSEEQGELFAKIADTLGTEVLPQERGFFDILRDAFSG